MSAVYVNTGNGPDSKQFEWNVTLDTYAICDHLEIFNC